MTSDIARLRRLRAPLRKMKRPGFGFTNDRAIAGTKSDIKMIEEAWPHDRLRKAYDASGGQPGDTEAYALLAEIQLRGMDL